MSGMFCVRQLRSLIVDPDPITRSIDHVLKYGERPTPCAPEWAEPHYKVSDRLSRQHLDRPVLYPSAFSRTGWGHRKLLPVELGHAFDLPPFVTWDDSFARRIVPVQLLRVVVDQVLDSLHEPSGEASPHVPTRTLTPAPATPPDGVFLSALGKWLPGEWADGLIAARAVKADDASVDFSPWHRRISLVLPCTSSTIQTLETFALCCWRRALCRSFLRYLAAEYGLDWQQRLWRGGVPMPRRRPRSQPVFGAAVQGDGELPGAPKRRRLVSGHHCNRGVLELVRSSQEDGGMDLREGLAQEEACDNEAWVGFAQEESCDDELRKDVNLGRAVLAQVLSSSWWDWSNGSSLFFWRWNGKEQRQAARDGIKIFVRDVLPSRRKIKQLRLDATQRVLVSQKLEGMLRRSYLEAGFVTNALHFFAVPKGDSDVRVVFDGTSSGLNETLWAPNFYLPTARAAALNLSYTTWMADMDCGEMFHNFHMDRRIRKCAGLQIGKLASAGESCDTTLPL